jgi:protein CpxP
MNEQRKPRLLYWTIALLVLCNIGLVTIIWFRPAGLPGLGGKGHESPRDFVVRNLRFTDEQSKQYDMLVTEHQSAMHRLRKDAMAYRQQLFGYLATAQSGSAEVDSMEVKIARTQKQIESTTYAHFAQVRNICTDAQKPEFDKIIGEVIRKMNGGPHGPPPPPGSREQGRPMGDNADGPPPPPSQNQ